jgi:hemolysin III
LNTATSQYTPTEETIHAISHGAGVAFSIAGVGWMLFLSTGDPWRIVASSVYGASLISLFLASTLYHSLHASPRRDFFKLLDHCTIYLLIAGTCTPFLLVAMQTNIRWWLFGAIWSLAAAGISAKLWLGHQFPRLSLASYLLMGWLMIIVTPQLVDTISAKGMTWVIAGGACYTLGTVFYMAKQIRFSHAFWHFFVLGGSTCHFLAVIWYVLPGHPPLNP